MTHYAHLTDTAGSALTEAAKPFEDFAISLAGVLARAACRLPSPTPTTVPVLVAELIAAYSNLLSAQRDLLTHLHAAAMPTAAAGPRRRSGEAPRRQGPGQRRRREDPVSGSLLTRPDGATIWWDVSGPEGAPAVVLVMGLGYPAAMWWRQVPALEKRFRVIVLDNRGAGHTGDVPGAPYTISTMAKDVVAVMDAAGESSAHVVGMSMGGMIAQEVALTHPDRVRSLALLATHPGAQHATFLPEAAALLQNRVGQTLEQAAEAALPFNYHPDTDRALVEQDWEVRFPLASSAAGYLAQLTGGFGWSSLERLPGLQLPVLVVHGDSDRLIPPVNGKLLADLVPGAELVLLEGANHVLTTDQAAAVNTVLETWLSKHS